MNEPTRSAIEIKRTASPTEPKSRLADTRSLRRIEVMTVVWAVIGVAVFLVYERGSDAFSLTVATAAVIVSFRGLQGIVAELGPDEKRAKRASKLFVLRTVLLFVFLVLGAHWASSSALGLIAGLTTLPAALMTEGMLQAIRTLQGNTSDGN